MFSKILPYLKHLFFICAIMLIAIGYNESDRSYGFQWDEMIVFLAISFLIIFFLWRSNYFKKN
ncbi:hypothetical protein OAO94_02180 [Flavobacteriaceae bacterium]|nr:hypothetical protein [Flavobacteriaceae bacterium]